MNCSGVVLPACTTDFPSGLEVVREFIEINESFRKGIERIEKMLEKSFGTDSLKNVNPSRLLLAGTCMTYAKHLASQGHYEEAIEQIKKAEAAYNKIDFSKVADQSCAKAVFLNNCTRLIKAYQLDK